MARDLRCVDEYNGVPDMDYLQRKISAAGEMKSAIKKALDETRFEMPIGSPDTGYCYFPVREKRLNDLRKAMEEYLNVG